MGIHIKRSHQISEEEFQKNKQWIAKWQKGNEESYLKFLSKKGALK